MICIVQISSNQIKATLVLFEEGATIPFIARYRKERTRSLDEVQIAEPEGSYLCISLAKKSTDQPGAATSVTIRLLVNEQLKRLFKWLNDPSLEQQNVHTTCERCAMEHCSERMAKPMVLEISKGLKKLKAVTATK